MTSGLKSHRAKGKRTAKRSVLIYSICYIDPLFKHTSQTQVVFFTFSFLQYCISNLPKVNKKERNLLEIKASGEE